MFKSKLFLKAIVCGLCCTLFFPAISGALTHHGNTHYNAGLKCYNETWFSPGVKTSSKYDKKMKSGKWAKNCWSKIVEGKDTSFKKTKTLSKAAAKSKKTKMQWASTSQYNNPLINQKYTYGWNYL